MRPAGFNPKARWDKRIPTKTDTDDQNGILNEPIAVLAWFTCGKLQPRLFVWHDKEYTVTAITFHWQQHHGRELISYFSVSTGANLYQISFNNATFAWRMDKIIS